MQNWGDGGREVRKVLKGPRGNMYKAAVSLWCVVLLQKYLFLRKRQLIFKAAKQLWARLF